MYNLCHLKGDYVAVTRSEFGMQIYIQEVEDKQEFHDAICLRYNLVLMSLILFKLPNLFTNFNRGQNALNGNNRRARHFQYDVKICFM